MPMLSQVYLIPNALIAYVLGVRNLAIMRRSKAPAMHHYSTGNSQEAKTNADGCHDAVSQVTQQPHR